MAKKSTMNKKEGRETSRLIRREFNALRRTLAGDVDDRIKLYEEYLIGHLAEHPKALAAARRGLRGLKTHLMLELGYATSNFRDTATEEALERQFKLLAIGGRVLGK